MFEVKKVRLLLALVFSGFISTAFTQEVFGRAYPWVAAQSDDVKIIYDSKVDASFRLHMVQQATQTLDIVTYSQRMDTQTAIPFFQAVKDAAKRGVKVRFMTSWAGSMMRDPWHRVKRFMTEDTQGLSIEFLVVGGDPMWKRGWTKMDGVHEKILIVDQKWALTTGRTLTDEALAWLDTAFVFRGPMVAQTVSAFNELWDTVRSEMGTAAAPFPIQETVEAPDTEIKTTELVADLSMNQVAFLQRLQEWMANPQSVGELVWMRVLHHDFMNQMRKLADRDGVSPAAVSNEKRAKYLEDPVVDEVIRLLADPVTNLMQFFAISTTFGEKITNALTAALDQGIRVELLINSKDSHVGVFPIPVMKPLLIPLGWYAGLNQLNQLMIRGAKVYQPKMPMFIHRKLVRIDDTVIFGSHNLTDVSTTGLDEISFEVKSRDFAGKVNRLFLANSRVVAEELDFEEVAVELEYSGFKKWVSGLFRDLF